MFFLLLPLKFIMMFRTSGVFIENIKIGLQSVRSHLLRSALTMLIIAFGITALVGILTAIDAIKFSLTNEFSRMGANTFSIRKQEMFARGGERISDSPSITYREAEEFRKRFGYGSTVSVLAFGNQIYTVKYENRKTNPNVSLLGCDENYLATSGYTLDRGRSFSVTEVEFGSNVAILGSVLAERLFQGVVDPVGKSISVGSVKYKVVGVLRSRGASMGFSNDNNVFVPVNNLRRMLTGQNPSFQISVKAADAASMDATIAEATSLFRKIRRLDPREQVNFAVESSDNLVQMLIDNISTITFAATGIGLITLLGAAIGLMNIMLVSVTERTREIGIRKAMGATRVIIRNQFLSEAVVIGILGGIIGILGGMLVGNITTMITGGKFIVPWGWMVMGVILCIVVGLVSGLYPASRAARLDPIESLRYE
jgi:putative ABC transport system permease protein